MKPLCSWFTAVLSLLAALTVHANKAILNADGVLEINGQKVFVIGFTAGPPPGSQAPNGKDAFAELADAEIGRAHV